MENNTPKENVGYIILERTKNIVIGFNPNNPAIFVTWQCNEEGDSFFWGHYFSNLEGAFNDYQKRINNQ